MFKVNASNNNKILRLIDITKGKKKRKHKEKYKTQYSSKRFNYFLCAKRNLVFLFPNFVSNLKLFDGDLLF